MHREMKGSPVNEERCFCFSLGVESFRKLLKSAALWVDVLCVGHLIWTTVYH